MDTGPGLRRERERECCSLIVPQPSGWEKIWPSLFIREPPYSLVPAFYPRWHMSLVHCYTLDQCCDMSSFHFAYRGSLTTPHRGIPGLFYTMATMIVPPRVSCAQLVAKYFTRPSRGGIISLPTLSGIAKASNNTLGRLTKSW